MSGSAATITTAVSQNAVMGFGDVGERAIEPAIAAIGDLL